MEPQCFAEHRLDVTMLPMMGSARAIPRLGFGSKKQVHRKAAFFILVLLLHDLVLLK
jgi:hypothetical protein